MEDTVKRKRVITKKEIREKIVALFDLDNFDIGPSGDLSGVSIIGKVKLDLSSVKNKFKEAAHG